VIEEPPVGTVLRVTYAAPFELIICGTTTDGEQTLPIIEGQYVIVWEHARPSLPLGTHMQDGWDSVGDDTSTGWASVLDDAVKFEIAEWRELT
jgi:hypothetical protein